MENCNITPCSRYIFPFNGYQRNEFIDLIAYFPRNYFSAQNERNLQFYWQPDLFGFIYDLEKEFIVFIAHLFHVVLLKISQIPWK